jgi:hypothetical protein
MKKRSQLSEPELVLSSVSIFSPSITELDVQLSDFRRITDQLVTDEKELERTAYVSGSLKALAALIQKLIPPAETPWFEDEAEAMSLLLEVHFILP